MKLTYKCVSHRRNVSIAKCMEEIKKAAAAAKDESLMDYADILCQRICKYSTTEAKGEYPVAWEFQDASILYETPRDWSEDEEE